MTSLPLFLLGLALLLYAAVDFGATTLAAISGPKASGVVARGVFNLLKRLARVLPRAPLSRGAGPLVLLAAAITWILGFSFGWAFLYHGAGGALALTSGPDAPRFWDVWAHVGHMLSTLGGANTKPSSTFWSVLDVLVAINGMGLLTLTMTFLYSITQTVNGGRALARRIHLDAESLDPRTMEADIAQLVSQIHFAPFALYFSHPDPASRFPNAVELLVRRAEAVGGDAPERLAFLLRGMPGLNPASAEEMAANIGAWRERFSLT
ncbi:hypothetical protein [Pseudoroseicyclus tamaricis]|uniref:Ion channel n=1 Tax=Pseudoroseicyclus tamaricis TaxID=2705421 RepID=A0A6B2JNK9_9RHOB|nr:hypothetical protein [Pseudoroseicyclus tamaricis]NDU99569.1 hypothetical protein [Pseudoroseicyclus tamaricis]